MAGYMPGEQPPPGSRVVKLNTNENPWGPPPEVLEAIRAKTMETLRLYPEPTARPVREAAARAYGVTPEQVLVGNGSDDLLTILLRTLLDPGEVFAAPEPTYTLYEPLTRIQGGRYVGIPWGEGLSLPVEALAAAGAKLTMVTRPNAPTGHVVPLEEVARLCRLCLPHGVVVLDEAYGDFAEDNGLPLLPAHPNLVVIRSFSKSLSLAGLRLGLGFMSRELAWEMHKVRDSYNVDQLAQAGAVAALENLGAVARVTARIKAERTRATEALTRRGFTVFPSQANFLLATIPAGRRDGRAWLDDLKGQGILVRYFGSDPRLADKLRITIGTPEEMELLFQAVDRLLADNGGSSPP